MAHTPSKRSAIYYGVANIRIEEIERPRAGDDGIVVRMKAAGICGSDLPAHKKATSRTTTGIARGHEITGEVVEVGANVKNGKVGDQGFALITISPEPMPLEEVDSFLAVLGFFVLGFDQDTPDAFEPTLEFCDEMDLLPVIGLLTPYPGTVQYTEFEKEGRLLPVKKYALFDSQSLLFQHPNLEADQTKRMLAETMKEGYSMSRILRCVWQDFRRQPNLNLTMLSFFTQLGIRQAARAGTTSD